MSRDRVKELVQLKQVERIAYIVGEYSAAAKALRFADEHGGRENAQFARTQRGTLLVLMNETLDRTQGD